MGNLAHDTNLSFRLQMEVLAAHVDARKPWMCCKHAPSLGDAIFVRPFSCCQTEGLDPPLLSLQYVRVDSVSRLAGRNYEGTCALLLSAVHTDCRPLLSRTTKIPRVRQDSEISEIVGWGFRLSGVTSEYPRQSAQMLDL